MVELLESTKSMVMKYARMKDYSINDYLNVSNSFLWILPNDMKMQLAVVFLEGKTMQWCHITINFTNA